MPELKQLLADITATIVDYPEQISIDENDEGDTVVFTLTVAESDMGKVIGKHGKIAKAIRQLMKAAANGTGKKVTIDIE